MTHTYQCAMCRGTFETDSVDAALAERDSLFPGEVASDADFAEVCDECWRKIGGPAIPEIAALLNIGEYAATGGCEGRSRAAPGTGRVLVLRVRLKRALRRRNIVLSPYVSTPELCRYYRLIRRIWTANNRW